MPCTLAASRRTQQALIGTLSYDGSRGTGLRQHIHVRSMLTLFVTAAARRKKQAHAGTIEFSLLFKIPSLVCSTHCLCAGCAGMKRKREGAHLKAPKRQKTGHGMLLFMR